MTLDWIGLDWIGLDWKSSMIYVQALFVKDGGIFVGYQSDKPICERTMRSKILRPHRIIFSFVYFSNSELERFRTLSNKTNKKSSGFCTVSSFSSTEKTTVLRMLIVKHANKKKFSNK